MAAILLAFWLAGVSQTAQPPNPLGTISGTVRDAQGGVVPGATITATLADARVVAVTNSRGQFQLQVAAGTHRVEVTMRGFLAVSADVTLLPAQSVPKDFVLEVAPLQSLSGPAL